MSRDSQVVATGVELTLEIEKVAVGGRMIARLGGRVVLVAGAIPGERVRAKVERVQRDVVYAAVTEVDRAHPARRQPGRDPACGGMTYSHVTLEHQRTLKREMVVDAFARIAHITLGEDVPVAPSPETAYRMRARVHVRGGRLGSFREGSHEVCDVAQTGQLSAACLAVLGSVAEACTRHAVPSVEAIDLVENLDGSQRVLNIEQAPRLELGRAMLSEIATIGGVTGVTRTASRAGAPAIVSGSGWVDDPIRRFVDAPGPLGDAPLRRHATAFFQANRFLAPLLAERVGEQLLGGPVLDLYSGVGLFALSAAARGHEPVVAIEGDEVSVADLRENARPFAREVRVVRSPVEAYLGLAGVGHASTVIVDPPRTGMSKGALTGVVALAAPRVVYVSCDVATLARDAQRLVGGGYRLGDISAFDLFPNTPHVEVMAVFDHPGPR